jgi:CheY-like chemotaxis protein
MHADTVDQVPAAARAGPTVLVIEEDATIRAFLRSALEDEGYRVLTAVTREALALAQAQRPDLILLDVHLPWRHQAVLSRHLRADPATAHIPLIGMISDYRVHNLSDQPALDACLRKPFDLAELYGSANKWWVKRREVAGGGDLANTAPSPR